MRAIHFILAAIISVGLASCDALGEHCPEEDYGISNCQLAPDPGDCEAAITKYYYDQASGTCKEFTWGGCGGTVPFHTLEECKECSGSGSSSDDHHSSGVGNWFN